jgi:Flp pilus assembly protein TadD
MDDGHMQRAQMLLAQNRHALAETELRRLLATDPEDGETLALLALCRMELDDPDGAEHFAGQAIGADPEWPFSYYVRALVLVHRGKLDDAARQMQRVIELAPADADYHWLLAAIDVGRNRSEAAVDAARIGLQHDPQHVNCLNLIARERTRSGHLAEAGSLVRASLEIEPTKAETLTLLGELQMREGDVAGARQSFDQSLMMAPGDPDAQSGLSEARRAGNAVYRRLLPLLLVGEKATRDEPIGTRIVLLTLIVVLWAWVVKLPMWRTTGFLLAAVGSAVLLILIFAKPLMNLKFSRAPLQWYALPWRERFMAGGLPILAAWLGTAAWIGWQGGINNPLFLLAVTAGVPLIPINAIGCHYSPEVKRRLWPYAVGAVLLWIVPVVGYCLDWIGTTETVGIFGAASLMAGGPKTWAMMDAEEGAE